MNSTSTLRPEQETPEIIIYKNCDHSFSGMYCSNCWQSVNELERPIRFMIADFMVSLSPKLDKPDLKSKVDSQLA